jgi:peptidoglycan/LPS O-acetylase OafA/YrhL
MKQIGDKNLPLESLRGVAALIVAIFHFEYANIFSNTAFIQGSYLMVDLFFVLSGYVIALNYFDRINQFNDLVIFQVKRFWRLYPLHLFTLFIFVGIEFLKYGFEMYTGIKANDPSFENNNLIAFINNLLLTHSFASESTNFNKPSWSISAEFYSYITFALIVLYFRKYFFLFSCLTVLVSGAMLIIYCDGRLTASGLPFIRCLYSFFLGTITWHLLRNINIKLYSTLPALMLITCVLSISIISRTDYETVLPLFFCLLVASVVVLDNNSMLNKVMSQPLLVYLGTISYSIYMIHTAIWWFVNQVLRFGLKLDTVTNVEGQIKLDLSLLESSMVLFIGVVLILVVSHISYKLIEDKYRNGYKTFSKSFSRQSLTNPAG